MTASVPPAGWYPDPSDDRQLRWWTGERWTGAARPVESASEPVAPPRQEPSPRPGGAAPDATQPIGAVQGMRTEPAAPSAEPAVSEDGSDPEAQGWPRERLIAAFAIGGLLLTSVAVWLFAVVLTDSEDVETAAEQPTAESDDNGGLDGEDSGEEEPGSADSDDDGATDGEAASDGDGEIRTVDFDGVCTVEATQAELDEVDSLRPWQFEECEHAPVDLDDSAARWVVVIASVDGELDSDAAADRASDHGEDYGLLWSSHYPSLNPGWWVVFDGPFVEEDDASEVAESTGGGAYPRLLSDDEGDRYCIAESGC